MSGRYRLLVEADDLGVDDEVLDVGLDCGEDVFADVWVLRSHVFEVPRVDEDPAVHVVHLAAEAVVLELAGEGLAFEALEDHVDAFGRLREHRLAGDARSQSAVLEQVLRVAFGMLQALDDQPVVGVLVAALLQRFFPELGRRRVVWVLVDLEVRACEAGLDRRFRAAHFEVASLQEADDHLGFEAGAIEEQVVEDAFFFFLAGELGQLVDLAEDVLELLTRGYRHSLVVHNFLREEAVDRLGLRLALFDDLAQVAHLVDFFLDGLAVAACRVRAALQHGLVADAQVLLQVLRVESAGGEEVEVCGFGWVEEFEGLDHVDEHSLLALDRVGSFHLGDQVEAFADEEKRGELVFGERRVLLGVVELELDVLGLRGLVLELLRHRGCRLLRIWLVGHGLLHDHLFAVAGFLRLLRALLQRLRG